METPTEDVPSNTAMKPATKLLEMDPWDANAVEMNATKMKTAHVELPPSPFPFLVSYWVG